jgi:hypothetical protein
VAYTKYDTILERVREILEDGYGSVRAINAGRFSGELYEGLPRETQTRLGILSQKPIEASIVEVQRHPQALVVTGSVQIERFILEVRVVRTLETLATVDDNTRDDCKALAAEDSDAIKQALEWPPNLATTQGGTATDCKALIHERSSVRLTTGPQGGAATLTTIHRFVGTALSRPAVA